MSVRETNNVRLIYSTRHTVGNVSDICMRNGTGHGTDNERNVFFGLFAVELVCVCVCTIYNFIQNIRHKRRSNKEATLFFLTIRLPDFMIHVRSHNL